MRSCSQAAEDRISRRNCPGAEFRMARRALQSPASILTRRPGAATGIGSRSIFLRTRRRSVLGAAQVNRLPAVGAATTTSVLLRTPGRVPQREIQRIPTCSPCTRSTSSRSPAPTKEPQARRFSSRCAGTCWPAAVCLDASVIDRMTSGHRPGPGAVQLRDNFGLS